MVKAIIELSNYILVLNLLLYTIISFVLLPKEDEERSSFLLVLQDVFIFINHLTGSLVLLSTRHDMTYLFYPVFQMIAIFSFFVLMRAIYPKSNRLLLNHIGLLLSVSFVILTRLSFSRSVKQFAIVAVSMIIALIIPSLMKYLHLLIRGRWILGILGVVLLGAVLVTGSIINGSKLSFSILGISFQPSEFIKILYVIFLAGVLSEARSRMTIFLSAVLAAAHVLVLVASKDLGSALIYSITYVILLYIATRKLFFILGGMAGAAAASVLSYYLFSHVRVRIAAWQNPWTDISATGYQIAQSLFAIGTGSWFGMGIDAGSPRSIPYVEQDFIFSAICEEYGILYGICLVAICVSLFLEIVHIAHACEESFLKYASYGLGIVYIFQIFLTIGGNTKFIPLTGVTLPLISYGGSSVLTTMLMFALLQGFYIYRYAILTEGELPAAPRIQMNVIAGVFSALFVAISVYLVHFAYYDSPAVVNNTYNSKRQELLATKTTRGDILASDGTVLATTDPDTDERIYPFENVYAHAVGYASHGRLGVEQTAGIYLVSSNVSLNNKIQDDLADEKHTGNSVYTTLDPQLQQEAYNALGMYEGAIIVTEPDTGRILALVSKPDFDPNTISEVWDDLVNDSNSSVLVNRATQGLYPPGSTFKILTALEYIRENPLTYQNYSFDCNGRFTSGEDTIRCFHGTKHGKVDFTTSFAKSCNSSFANMGLTLSRTSFEDTLSSLYFNQSLPVDLTSNISKVSIGTGSSDSDLIQTVIGQGTTQMTPLHLSMITSMIANRGIMMQPYIIDRVESADGNLIKSFSPDSLGQLISEEEADILKNLMIAVVQEGTGTRLKGQSYQVAGKTGSAEYNSQSDSHAWFTGFSYDTDRPLQVTVIMEGAGSGGEYAVPVAKRIFDQYYNE